MSDITNRELAYIDLEEKFSNMTFDDVVEFSFRDTVSKCRNERYLNYLLKYPTNRKSAAVIFIDILGFQSINAKYGNTFGHKVLKKVGNMLLSYFKPSDDVIRYYGDVFVVIMYDVEISEMMSRVVSALDGIEAMEFNSQPGFHVKMSAGGHICSQLTDNSLVRADLMLHKAKSSSEYRIMIEQFTSNWVREFTSR